MKRQRLLYLVVPEDHPRAVFDLMRRARRSLLLREPFREAWQQIIDERLPFYAAYDEATKQCFREHVQVFIAEKNFEGVGIELDDEIKVVIAGEAARLIAHLDIDLYDAIESIVVRPTHMAKDDAHVLGLVHRFGTVMLAWDAVERGLRNEHDGLNTALHEFAHAIDLVDGDFDGTPPLPTSRAVRAWATVFAKDFLALQADPDRDVLRAYGAENEAEFFAVAVEVFFEKPRQLKKKHPALYAQLAGFFKEDPAG